MIKNDNLRVMGGPTLEKHDLKIKTLIHILILMKLTSIC
jgi:hypothetical protein